jgi:hypothetical protein
MQALIHGMSAALDSLTINNATATLASPTKEN